MNAIIQKLLFIFCIPLVSCGERAPVPSDDELEENFYNNRAAYEEILFVLSATPSIRRVDAYRDSFGDIEIQTIPQIESRERINKINEFIRRTNVNIIQALVENGKVIGASFTHYAAGLSVSGVSKGIVYITDPSTFNDPGQQLDPDCLDKYTSRQNREYSYTTGIFYCSLDSNWYIYVSL